MNLIFRLSKHTEGFENIQATKYFFHTTLKADNNNTFHTSKRLYQINSGDTIYFAYKSLIVTKAIYIESDDRPNYSRDSKFNIGHKLRSIQTLNRSKKLDYTIVSTMTTYINNTSKQKEVERVISNN